MWYNKLLASIKLLADNAIILLKTLFFFILLPFMFIVIFATKDVVITCKSVRGNSAKFQVINGLLEEKFITHQNPYSWNIQLTNESPKKYVVIDKDKKTLFTVDFGSEITFNGPNQSFKSGDTWFDCK